MNDSKSPHNFIASHLKDVPRSGIRDFFDIVSTRKDIISLGIGEPDFTTPWHIRESSIFALEHGNTNYTSNLGLLELRKQIATYVRNTFHASYNHENEILVTVGVSEALDLALRSIINPGDEVIYHEPSYVSYAPVIRFSHGKPVPIATNSKNGFRITKKLLDKHLTSKTKAIILNFPTNPTGAVLERNNVEEIAKFAIQHELLIIADEIYAELTYDQKHISMASIPGMKERTILLNGFSKSWAMTGFRIGFSCSTPELTEAMMKIHQYTMMCAPTLSQKAAIEAMTNGNNDIDAMRNEYKKRRLFLHNAINDIGIPCHLPEGAFYLFPDISKFGMTSKEFALRLLNEQKVACVPGSAFGESGEGFIRCCYATSMDEIKEATKRIKAFIKTL